MHVFKRLAASLVLAMAALSATAETIQIPVEASQPVGSRTPAQTKEALIEALTLSASQKVPRTAIASSLIKDGMSEQSLQLISGAAISLGNVTWGSAITGDGEVTMTAKAMATADLAVNEKQLAGVRASIQAQQQIAALTRQLDIKQRELDAMATRMAGVSGEDAAPLLVAQSRLIADISALRQKGYDIAITTTTGTLGDAIAAEHATSASAAANALATDEAGRLIADFKRALASYINSCAPSRETTYRLVIPEADAYRLKTARSQAEVDRIAAGITELSLEPVSGQKPVCDEAKRMAAYAVLAPAFLGSADQIESRAAADYWAWLDTLQRDVLRPAAEEGLRPGEQTVASEDLAEIQKIHRTDQTYQIDRMWYGFFRAPYLRVFHMPQFCDVPPADWFRRAKLGLVPEYEQHPSRACQRANPVAMEIMARLQAEVHDGSLSCSALLSGIGGFRGSSISQSKVKRWMHKGGGHDCKKRLAQVFGGSVMYVDFPAGDRIETVEIYQPAASLVYNKLVEVGELSVAYQLEIPASLIRHYGNRRNPTEAVGIRTQLLMPAP